MKLMHIIFTMIILGGGIFMAFYTGDYREWFGFDIAAGFIMFIIYKALTSRVF